MNDFIGKNIEAFGSHEYFRKAGAIRSKSVYVCNLWFEGKGYWEKALETMNQGPSPVLITTGYRNMSVMINRSIRMWADSGRHWVWSDEYVDKNVTVLEVHVARAEEVSNIDSKEIAALVYGDLKNFIPDLPEPKGHYVNRWNTYLNCYVGEEAKRPAIQSPIDNLLFIGDVVWLPHSSQWMEKTNVTAKWATNLILDKAGQNEGKITILPSAILSLPMKALASRHDVFLPEDKAA